MRKYTKLIIALSLIPQILLIKVLANFPEFVENYYSNGFEYLTKVIAGVRFADGVEVRDDSSTEVSPAAA